MQASDPCDLCGSRDAVVIGRLARDFAPLRSVVCRHCGLARQDPMPSDAALLDFYARSYRLSYKSSASPRARDLERDRRRAEERLRLLAPVLKPGMRLLDVGSGTGMFLLQARAFGLDAQGLEPDANYSERLRREEGLQVHSGAWDTADFAPGSFDIVVIHHVLEHLRTPTAALRRMHEWTAPDGHLYLSVPDLKNPNASPFNRFHRAHLYGYSPEALEMIALKAGFARTPLPGAGGTTLVFRRLAAPPENWFLYPDHGEDMVAFYRRYTLRNYLLSPLAYRRFARHVAHGIRGR